MIHVPIPEIITKINSATGLSEAEILSKITAKQKQLSGLVSQEGAAHIIANELGVKLIDTISGKLQIKNIVAGIRSLETVGKVVSIYEVRTFMRGESTNQVGSFLIGDETGTIRVVCWGEQAKCISRLNQNDIVMIKEGYVRDNQGRIEIHVNERGLIMINPKNITVGEVNAAKSNIAASARKKISELAENDNNVEILGTIVQVFDPRFFETCPQCGKRLRQSDGQLLCQMHNVVTPKYSYVMNVFVDDGTENIRVVCFRQQMEELLQKKESELIKYKESPETFEPVKNDLLGKIVKIIGRTNTNSMFGKLEFTANKVITDPNPEDEIKTLKTQIEEKIGKSDDAPVWDEESI